MFRDVSKLTAPSGQVSFDGFAAPLKFLEKTDMEIRASGSSNNNEVSGVFSAFVIKN